MERSCYEYLLDLSVRPVNRNLDTHLMEERGRCEHDWNYGKGEGDFDDLVNSSAIGGDMKRANFSLHMGYSKLQSSCITYFCRC